MGHREHRETAPKSITLAVITVSDTRTPSTDESGMLICDLCRQAGHQPVHHVVVPDEPGKVRSAVSEALARPGVQAVLVNGGTGISGRDRTFEAISGLFELRLDGFGELFRHLSYQEIGPAAMLSRAVAGVVLGRPVFSMPGSPAAVRLAMERLILPELAHVVAEAAKRS
jgi:molybdenum cofactor biosynthesis protein B